MVWNKWTDVFWVPCVEVSWIDPPSIIMVAFFTGSVIWCSFVVIVVITATALVIIVTIAASVSIVISITISCSISIAVSISIVSAILSSILITVAVLHIRSSIRISEVFFGPVVLSVILNFPALFGPARSAAVVALDLLLVAASHVPLGDRMVEALEARRLAQGVGLRNLVAHAVVEERRLCCVRSRHPKRRVGRLRNLVARGADRSSSDVLRRTRVHLLR